MDLLQAWFTSHPQLAGLAVFLIALAESLAIVGLLVPGVAMMFVAGAFIGTGALAFGPICAWAVAGAIAGDGLSFWLGRRFGDRLHRLPPFRSHPAMIAQGIAYFRRYGGRSVLFGRFFGPMRALIPLIAGMLAMPAGRFLAVNIASALLWGPAYLLPGIAFGASLDLASRVAGRLVTLLVLLVALAWFSLWFAIRLYGSLAPRAHALILASFAFGRRHPWLGRMLLPLIDPRQRDNAGLALWAALLTALALLLILLAPSDWPVLSLEALRAPWADRLLGAIAALAGTAPLALVVALVAAWLWASHRPVALSHWLVGSGYAWAAPLLFDALASGPPPIDAATFRIGGIVGLVAVLAAAATVPRRRWLAFGGATLFVLLTGIARLYFNDTAAFGVLTAWLMAPVWVVVAALAYLRHRSHEAPPTGFAILMTCLLALPVLGAALRPPTPAILPAPTTLSVERWLAEDWGRLPTLRTAMFGHPDQLLAIQWAATLKELRHALLQAGWRDAPELDARSAMNWLNPDAGPSDLPALAHFNHGDADRLRMIRRSGEGWLMIRVWPSAYALGDAATPLWLAACARLDLIARFGLLRLGDEHDASIRQVEAALRAIATTTPSLRIVTKGPADRPMWLICQEGAEPSGMSGDQGPAASTSPDSNNPAKRARMSSTCVPAQ